ncbi:MAG TPA: hypothetical protein VM845_12975 [Burkholderiaceae bacterium]|nr:hypothetical protein [Burkholderiaceae bacterium]
MTDKTYSWRAALVALMAALLPCAAALAQVTSTPASRPDPADAAAATPALQHRSALAATRRVSAEAAPLAWREANERVERIGGWRAYAREAQAPAAAASAPAPR